MEITLESKSCMRQVFNSYSDGKIVVGNVPVPTVQPGYVLIETIVSLISSGTERSLVDFGRSSYIEKARQQPDKVKMVLEKVKADGVLATMDAVKSKLDQPVPMGYSNVGRVLAVGQGVENLEIGDMVVSNGKHAEVVSVPKNLCAKVPVGVSAEAAVFAVVGAIALQGVRIAEPTLGESVVVMGLGLIGLMTVQLLLAQGCRVLGVDFDKNKLELAKSYGADVVDLTSGQDPISLADRFSRERGVDAVLVTASTKSSDPIHQAATMCRKRGRIVLVGVTGLELNRSDFYEKELSFQVSCSYGPGRYDPSYEECGNDYPFGFVRWTEQRNFEAVLDLMAAERICVEQLKSKSFVVEDAQSAYDFLLAEQGALGVLISYPNSDRAKLSPTVFLPPQRTAINIEPHPTLAVIGAGNYAGRVLLPAMSKAGARLKIIASANGLSGTYVGRKLGFESSTTDVQSIFTDPEVDAVVIATQHNSHSKFVVNALDAGKSVFVEKPLALSQNELMAIKLAYENAIIHNPGVVLMVGFNRRFSPCVQKLRELTAESQAPMSIIYTCNAGSVPRDSWVHDPERGGGRIIGEACHFIDIARFLANSPISAIKTTGMTQPNFDCHDTATISLSFENGSLATVHYFANGSKAFPKERIEVFQGGNIFQVDNYKKLVGYGSKNIKLRSFKQDKGQQNCSNTFIRALKGEVESPIAFSDLIEVSRATISASEQLACLNEEGRSELSSFS